MKINIYFLLLSIKLIRDNFTLLSFDVSIESFCIVCTIQNLTTIMEYYQHLTSLKKIKGCRTCFNATNSTKQPF